MSKLVLSVALCGTLFLTNCAKALYEKDMGRNDWRVETLGDLTDMIFIGENQAYTLSSDALLTLFDTSTQTIQWKKQLPVSSDENESYQLRHLGRNLLVQSNERVFMVNSVGHVIFEQPLTGGEGPSKIDIFTHQSKVHSVFARGNFVTIYLQHQEIGTFELPQFTEIADKFESIDPKPVEIIYSPESQQLLVIVKVASSEAKNEVQVATYEFKLDSLEIELRNHAIVPHFTHSDRTSKFIIIYTDETLTNAQAYTPEDFSRPAQTLSQISSKPSKNDDFIFVQNTDAINYHNLSNGSESVTTVKDAKYSKECQIVRAREPEQDANQEFALVQFAINCPQEITLRNMASANSYSTKTAKNGKVIRMFVDSAGTQAALLFEDLSLHLISSKSSKQDPHKLWQREESLSQVVQVEIFDKNLLARDAEEHQSGITYVNNINEPVSFAQVPARILRRYQENFAYLIRSVKDLMGSDVSSTIGKITASKEVADMLGFDKTLILLTKPNKIHAISSNTGNLLWSYWVPEPIQRLFVEQNLGQGEVKVVSSSGKLTILDPISGAVLSQKSLTFDSSTSAQDLDFVLMRGVSKDNGLVRASLASIPKSGEGKVTLLDDTVEVKSENNLPQFFTQLDKEANTIGGYKLCPCHMSIHQAWSMKLDSSFEIVDMQTQYQSASAATKPDYFLPTVFGQDGSLFYKYLDSNMFALVSRSKENPQTVEVQVINGVTGRVVHQFQEKDVSDSPKHPISTIFTENYLIMSFMRNNPTSGLSQQELTVVELFHQRQETDTQALLTDYVKGDPRVTEETFSSFLEESQPVVLHEAYILPFGVKALSLTETVNHITSRSLILVTHNNQLFTIKETLFSARRPRPEDIKKEPGYFDVPELEDLNKPVDLKKELKSKVYTPYNAMIPKVDKHFASYNTQLINMKSVQTFSTRLESTSVVFAHGHDLFMARVRPDGQFDILDEDFKFELLFAFIGFLIIGNFAIQRFTSAQAKKKAFLTM